MQLVPVNIPSILPGFAACRAARLIDGHHSMYFAAGRQCAADAIVQLTGQPAAQVPKGGAGEPMWPDDLVGSITHTGDFVAAVVARRSHALGIGLDAEQLMTAARASGVANQILLPEEVTVGGDSITAALRVTLFFSIKEAVFKCLYPLVLRRFYYDALAVRTVDPTEGTFLAELMTDLSEAFRAGQILSGHFAVDDRRVYSGLWLQGSEVTPSSPHEKTLVINKGD